MKVIELLKSLCGFDNITIIISLIVAILSASISNLTKSKKLKLYLPFVLGVVVCLIYRVFTGDKGITFEIFDVTNGFLCGSISYVLYAIYNAFTTSNGVSGSPKTSTIIGLLESYGIKNAEDLAIKLIDEIKDSAIDDNNTEEIIYKVLKSNLVEYSDEDVKTLTDAIYNLITTL